MRNVALAAAVFLLTSVQACGDRGDGTVSNAAGTAADQAGNAMQDASQEATAAVDAPREFDFDSRQEFAQSLRQQLAEADQQIEELSAQAKSAGGAVSDNALANIRAARRAVERNLARVDNATAENWVEIRRGVEEAMDTLDEAVERAQPK